MNEHTHVRTYMHVLTHTGTHQIHSLRTHVSTYGQQIVVMVILGKTTCWTQSFVFMPLSLGEQQHTLLGEHMELVEVHCPPEKMAIAMATISHCVHTCGTTCYCAL